MNIYENNPVPLMDRPLKLLRILWKSRFAYLFISPFFILFFLFFLYPAINSFYLSAFKIEPFGSMKFVGLDNYRQLFNDDLFFLTAGNSFFLMLTTTISQVILAVGLAGLINARFVRHKELWRTLFFLPITLSPVIVAVIFTLMFDKNYGFINYVLTGLHFSKIGWLTTTEWSKIAVTILVDWRWLGWNIVILIAGLQGISQELLDAASVDGANEFQSFWHITIPLLKPIIIYITMLSVVDGLRIFTEPSVLTKGGPDRSSMTVMMYLFENAFNYFNFGYASAIAVVSFLMIVLISSIFWLILSRNAQED